MGKFQFLIKKILNQLGRWQCKLDQIPRFLFSWAQKGRPLWFWCCFFLFHHLKRFFKARHRNRRSVSTHNAICWSKVDIILCTVFCMILIVIYFSHSTSGLFAKRKKQNGFWNLKTWKVLKCYNIPQVAHQLAPQVFVFINKNVHQLEPDPSFLAQCMPRTWTGSGVGWGHVFLIYNLFPRLIPNP